MGRLLAFEAGERPKIQSLLGLSGGESHEVYALYPLSGCIVRSILPLGWEPHAPRTAIIKADDHQRTTIEGIYATGDVVTDLHQLSVAFGHAAIAATHVHNRLPPNPR
jgi:thioredoxin reductase (NADPH)